MKKFHAREKSFFPVLLTIFLYIFGYVNAWGSSGDIVFMYNGSSIGSTSSYGAKSGNYTDNGITMNVLASFGYNNSPTAFWLGSNKENSNIKRTTLASYPPIASSLNLLRTKEGIAALVFERNLTNIGKVTYTHNEGQPNVRIALVYSKDSGGSYVQLGEWEDLGTSKGSMVSFEFPTIPSAQYAIVIDSKASDSEGFVQSRVPVVTFYEGSSDVDYIITPIWNESLGEVEVRGNIIVLKPDACSEYGNPACEIISGTATVNQDGDLFVADASEDFTIQINFVPKLLHQVTLSTGSVITQENCLAAIDLPVMELLEDYVQAGWRFSGWSEEEAAGNPSNITLILAGKETYMPQQDVILYAVYEKTERIDINYNLVAGISQLEDGTYLLGSLIDKVYHFFNGSVTSSIGGTVSSNSNSKRFETIPNGAIELTLESTSEENQYAFRLGSDYLGSSKPGSGGLELGSVNTSPWILSFSGSSLNSMRYSVSGKNAYLRGYKDSNGIVSLRPYAQSTSTTTDPVVLFKKILTPVVFYSSNPDCSVSRNITWKGLVNDDWSLDANWAPVHVPTRENDVVISAEAPCFPVLKDDGSIYECNNITFEMGGQIGRVDLLNYNKAHVQLNFGVTGMTDRWHMLSMPIQNVLTGDLAFGGAPSVFLRKFDANISDDGSWMKGNWSNYKTSNIESFGLAEGFILWVNGKEYNDTNLAAVSNVLELPCFENTDESGINIANPYHHYDAIEQKSTFNLFNSEGEVVGQEISCTRDIVNDYRFIYEKQGVSGNIIVPIAFGNTGLALVGNPYMSSLDFNTFYTDNFDALTGSYQIWTGTGFSVYTKGIGYSGNVQLNQYIAPMQSFIVEKNEMNNSSSLVFNAANVSVVSPSTSDSKLRAFENSIDKLDIIASNGSNSILTFIANREDGSVEFGNKDSRKLLLGISNAPEIYTIKGSPNGEIGVGANIINTNDITIPMGLATKHLGNITLTFRGMDNYNANITFIDKKIGMSENITGKAVYEYSFDYISPQKENVVIANEERFAIQFTPIVSAGLDNGMDVQIQSYSKNNAIFLSSNLLNLIKQVMVYNAQGVLVYVDENVDSPNCTIYSSTIPDFCIIKLITENGTKNIKILKK